MKTHIVAILFILVCNLNLSAQQSLGVFDNFWSNTKNSFVGKSSWYHVASFGSTYILVASDADREIQDYFQKDPIGESYGLGAFIFGAVWQPIVGGVLYFSSDSKTKTAGSAVLQAALIQTVYTTLLKGLTGRPDPIEGGDLANKEDGICGNSSNSKIFFDFIDGCTYPSGHTSSVFSLVSSLYAFYPEKPWIAYFGYPIALAVGIGMVESDEHWFSDIVAGALIGHIIGWTVGTNFRKNFEQKNSTYTKATQKHFITPLVSPTKVGVVYQFKF